MTALDLQRQGARFDAQHAILAQVGWVGHAKGTVYGLGTTPGATEPGGYSPLYIQVGTYVTDDDGNRTWRD